MPSLITLGREPVYGSLHVDLVYLKDATKRLSVNSLPTPTKNSPDQAQTLLNKASPVQDDCLRGILYKGEAEKS